MDRLQIRIKKIIWIFVAIALLIGIGKFSYTDYAKSKFGKDIYAYVDSNLKSSFKTILKDKDLEPLYNISYSKEISNSNIIFTSDFNKINLEENYEFLNYTPLIFAMKETKELNNFLTSKSENGWFVSDSPINNSPQEQDIITCDFKKVFDVVISGGNWSNLGGSNKDIVIYCPILKSIPGQLFKEFLVCILNDGSKISNEEIDSKINKFFSLPNVIMTDVISKLQMLNNNNIPSNAIYVALEADFLNYVRHENDIIDISFIYPKTCVISKIYLQYIDVDDRLVNKLQNTRFHFDGFKRHICMSCYYYYNKYYRSGEKNEIYEYEEFCKYYNIQKGINTFDMKI